nr:MAG TPA: hypothetical protein [Caudoviricetes sp.]
MYSPFSSHNFLFLFSFYLFIYLFTKFFHK